MRTALSFLIFAVTVCANFTQAGPNAGSVTKAPKSDAVSKVMCNPAEQLAMSCAYYCRMCQDNKHPRYDYDICVSACEFTNPLRKRIAMPLEDNCKGCVRGFKIQMATELPVCNDGPEAYQSALKNKLRHSISLSSAREICEGYKTQIKNDGVTPAKLTRPNPKSSDEPQVAPGTH